MESAIEGERRNLGGKKKKKKKKTEKKRNAECIYPQAFQGLSV